MILERQLLQTGSLQREYFALELGGIWITDQTLTSGQHAVWKITQLTTIQLAHGASLHVSKNVGLLCI